MADFEDGGGGRGGLGGGLIINWVPKLIDTQIDLIADTFTSLTSPNPNPTPKPTPTAPPDSCHLPEVGSSTVHHLLRRLAHGLLGAVYTGMVLALVMAVAVILGLLVVNYWLEEPVVVKEQLQFDFTDFNPQATFVFGGGAPGERKRKQQQQQQLAMVPVGHTFHVSVELLVPDSDYNRDIGVFQIMAEVISTNGKIIAKSSQPSMLIYQSHPVRLMHTLLMGLPLLLGLTRETQKIKVQMLKCKEDSFLRTEAIRITLMPRAGTPYLPQLYEARILVHSRLPWVKELIHDWKWTFYVWTSLHIYIMLLTLILCFCRPLLVFPVLRAPCAGEHRHEAAVEGVEKTGARMPEEREFTETLRKWQQYRRKRKAELLSKSSAFMESVSLTSASSYTMTKDTGPGIEEVGDSESVCLDS